MGKPLAVIKAGDTFPDLAGDNGDFEDWIIRGMGRDSALCPVINAEKEEPLPAPETLAGAVISGSHAMVTQDLDWSLVLERWTVEMVRAGVPVLGICYGHQILARATGGRVDFHPEGAEVGTTEVTCLPACETDPLFKGMPGRFKAHVVHSQSVVELPGQAVLLVRNDYEPHHAFRVGKAAWGVQFHPEFFEAVSRGYTLKMADTLTAQGQDPERVLAGIKATPDAADLLRRFGDLVLGP